MKVLHIVRQYKPTIGGLQNFVDSLTVHLQKAGIQSEVLTLDKDFANGKKLPEQSDENGIKVTRIPGYGSRRYPIAFSAIQHISTFDILHIHAVDFFIDYFSILKFLHRKPIILSTHGGFFHTKDFHRLKKIYFNTITRVTLLQTNKVIAGSENDYSMFLPLVPQKMQLIETGIDFDTFHLIHNEVGEEKHLIFVGRFSDNKRIDLLLQLVKKLKNQHPDIKLTVVGSDYDNLKSVYEKMIIDYGISKHVLIKESLSQQALLKEMAKATFFISASEYEGFGISSLEAMAAGRIPLLSDIPSFRRMINDNVNGYQLNFENIQDSITVINKAFALSSSEKQKMQQAAISTARSYSWAEVVNGFKTLYIETLEKQSS